MFGVEDKRKVENLRLKRGIFAVKAQKVQYVLGSRERRIGFVNEKAAAVLYIVVV